MHLMFQFVCFVTSFRLTQNRFPIPFPPILPFLIQILHQFSSVIQPEITFTLPASLQKHPRLSNKCFPLCYSHIYMTKKRVFSSLQLDSRMAILLFVSLKWKAGEAHYLLNTPHPHPLLCVQTNGLDIYKTKT